MAYAGLETLFQNMGPTYAASMAGEREGMAQNADTLDALIKAEAIKKSQQEYAQQGIMNPLAAQHKQGQIAEQAAMLPGQQAQSRSLGTTADIGEATKGGTIDAANSANKLKQQADALKTLDVARQALTQLVQTIGSGPDAEARKRQLLQSGQVSAGPYQELLMRTDARQLPQILSGINTHMEQQSGDFIKAMALQKEQTRSHLSGIKMQTDTQERINTANNEAGRYAKSKAGDGLAGIKLAVQSGKMTAEKAAVALQGAAMFEQDPETRTKYEEAAAQFEQFAMNQKRATAQGKTDIGAVTGLPTTALPQTMGKPAAKPSLPPGWVMK